MAGKSRVVIANSTRAMRDMLFDAIRQQSDISVVAEVSDSALILTVCELMAADCVVVPLERGGVPTKLCNQVLRKYPQMRVVALTATSDIVALCWRSGKDVRCTYMESSRDNILKALCNKIS